MHPHADDVEGQARKLKAVTKGGLRAGRRRSLPADGDLEVDLDHDISTLEGIAVFQQQLLTEIRSEDRRWSQREIVAQVQLVNGCIRRREAWEKLQLAKSAVGRRSTTPRVLVQIANFARLAPPQAALPASEAASHEADQVVPIQHAWHRDSP